MAIRGKDGDPRNGHEDPTGFSERELVERWKKAPHQVIPYKEGVVELPDGTSYSYRDGRRLLVIPGGMKVVEDGKVVLDKNDIPIVKGGKVEQVMDTCEFNQAEETVRLAFEAVQADRKRGLRVLEFGIGLRIAANRFIEQFTGRNIDGLYVGVDLNEGVYNDAVQWQKGKEEELERKKKEGETSAEIHIRLIRGEAGKVARDLLKEIGDDESQKFDIIYSDTFPLSPDEAGINDWKHIEVLKKLLAKGGAFSFFPFTPGKVAQTEEGLAGIVTGEQINLINAHFEKPLPGRAKVLPPREYKYLWRGGKPVLWLPVMVCQDPIFREVKVA